MFLAITVFVIAVKEVGRTIDISKRIGRTISTWIYIIQPIFITILSAITKKIGTYSIYQYGVPIVVYCDDCVCCVCIRVKKEICFRGS